MGRGVAQYFTYSINDWLQVGFRGEIFRDSQGFYVAQFRDNNDYLHVALQGRAVPFDPSNLGGGDTTYLELTEGVTVNRLCRNRNTGRRVQKTRQPCAIGCEQTV